MTRVARKTAPRKMTPAIVAKKTPTVERDYDDYVSRNSTAFATQSGPLFMTDAAEKLFDVYLGGFDEAERQYHNCHACRTFMQRFGALARVSDDGQLIAAAWEGDDVPDIYADAVAAVRRVVSKARITGVFLSAESMLGTPDTKGWHHFALVNPRVFRHALMTPFQAAAEKTTEYETVSRALGEFASELLDQVIAMLDADALYRADRVIAPVRWLRDVQKARDAAKGQNAKRNIVWRAVAAAPAGFCHPRSSVVGSLLDDLASGSSFDAAAKRFSDKMHPLRYQRPTEAPKAAEIEAAERVIATLGAAGSLERRFMRFDEIPEFIWRRAETEKPKSGGVFGHLKAKGEHVVDSLSSSKAIESTWEKFVSSVLPTATRIEFMLPSNGNYCGMVTNVHPDAPPILQWDTEAQRNPASWYVYTGGSTAYSWGLTGGEWFDVPAITNKPSMWFGDRTPHQGNGVVLVLPDAKDSRQSGSALFPETLKAELHAIRRTVEAFSRSRHIEGRESASANGYMFGPGMIGARLCVTVASGARMLYVIDRWN